MNRLLPLSILLIFHTINGLDNFEKHLVADKNGIFHIYWIVKEENITFELQVATKGYVGFGFSSNGGMPGSDIVIGWVLPNGTCPFQDTHAIGFDKPIVDKQQNYQLINCYENDTHTVLRFTRQLNTCDKEDDMALTDGSNTFIFCWHPDDPQDIAEVPYHGSTNRGSKSKFLISPEPKFEITNDTVTWDMQMPNVTIPAKQTTYWCHFVKLPDLDEAHDFTGYSVHITPGNENLAHHIVIWSCNDNSNNVIEKVSNKNGYECVLEGTLQPPSDCMTVFAVTGIGSEGQLLPEDVGIRVGQQYGGPSYFMLECHYNNVEERAGIVDSSILRMYLSKKLRPIMASTFSISANPDARFVIPPQQQQFKVAAVCPPECIKSTFPAQGISIFGVGLHAHYKGRTVQLKHFRDGKELKPIATDEHFNFKYQGIRNLQNPVTVLPGDLLMAYCEYNTMDTKKAVLGNEGSAGEMCFIAVSYYPAMPLASCHSWVNLQTIFDYFGIGTTDLNNIDHTSPGAFRKPAIIDWEVNYNWNNISQEKMKEMQYMQFGGMKTSLCTIVQNHTTEFEVTYQPMANISSYVPEDECGLDSKTPLE